MNQSCTGVRPLIHDYLEGELGSARADTVREHLEICGSCRGQAYAWNEDLARRIVAAGGQAWAFRYVDNNHALKASKNTWFSPPGTPDGLPLAVARDAVLFNEGDPREVDSIP